MADESESAPIVSRAVVVGAGTMGTGIAQVLAFAGIDVGLVDADAAALGRAAEVLAARLAPRKDAAGKVTPLAGVEAVAAPDAPPDVVIEAVPESLELKRAVFAALDSVLGEPLGADVLLATNTSSLSVTAIAEGLAAPERVVGMHFMNPAPVMKLVEVVWARGSSEDAVACAVALAKQIGKKPVVVADTPGFVVNRVLIPMINEAARALADGAADPESIDAAMKLGANFPMGPLHLADLIGIDVVVEELREFERAMGAHYAPARELLSRLERGELGRKTGRGFFQYGR
ncbi:MAG: 3-hydroxyacyl-CoA dehydrogenase family protein [Planctomycetota bacterium]|jgi:3-hydroxybutyryl-CoA dehydrogenase